MRMNPRLPLRPRRPHLRLRTTDDRHAHVWIDGRLVSIEIPPRSLPVYGAWFVAALVTIIAIVTLSYHFSRVTS